MDSPTGRLDGRFTRAALLALLAGWVLANGSCSSSGSGGDSTAVPPDVAVEAAAADSGADAAPSADGSADAAPSPDGGPECIDDFGCPSDQICSDGACVVGCRKDAQCPKGQYCNNQKCAECRLDTHCSVPTPRCLTSIGSCVECLGDPDCGLTGTCDPLTNRCLMAKGRPQCSPCTTATQCAVGLKCVSVVIDAKVSEQVCLKACATSTTCDAGYGCGSASSPKVTQYCWPAYGVLIGQLKTCAALRDQGSSCVGDDGCGWPKAADASCSLIEGGVCRVPCSPKAKQPCVSGTACLCPAGYALNGLSCETPSGEMTFARCL